MDLCVVLRLDGKWKTETVKWMREGAREVDTWKEKFVASGVDWRGMEGRWSVSGRRV